MVDTVETAIYRLRAEGQQQVDALKASVDGLVVSEEKLGQTTERVNSSALQNRLARMDPLIRAQQQYAKELESAKRYVEAGVGTQAQQSAQIELATQRYHQQVTAIKAAAGATKEGAAATGLARHELVNLGRQAQDIGVSLASGQSPFMVLIQQGTQVADVFATSGGTLRGFFSQVGGWATAFLKSTTGIVTSVLAIGGAAIFAASQFARASTTIEQALETQNRLLKEGKALLDARTSAEARAQLQSKEQTQFETLRNQLDLQNKLNKAMEDAANLAQRRSGTPTGGGMPEMGIAPTGFAPLKDPGLDKMFAAYEQLKAAQAAGLPGIKQFNAELAKVGLAHPELALVVEDMIKAGEVGMKLELAALQAKAMADAMAGVATNAQMAAVGLNSVAQFKLNNLEAEEAKESAERYAVAILKVAESYPGMSIAAVKMLDSLNRQLEVAQAVGQMAQIEAQHRTRIVELSQRMKEADATRVAGLERAGSLAKIEADHKQQMIALQGQLNIEKQVTDIGRINAQYKATVALLELQIGRTKAIEQAEMGRKIAVEQLHKAEEQRRRDEERAHDEAIRNIKSRTDAWKAYADGVISWSEANDEAGNILRRQEAAAEDAAHAMNRFASSMFNATQAALLANSAFVPFATTWASMGPTSLGTGGAFQGKQGLSQFDPSGYTSTVSVATQQSLSGTSYTDPWSEYYATLAGGLGKTGKGMSTSLSGGPGIDTDKLSSLERMIALMSREQQITATQSLIQELNQRTPSLERDESINRLTQSLNQLRDATEANTEALRITTDPLISQGHDYLNNLKIGYHKAASGFDGIARGGIPGVDSIPFRAMVQDGERITITPRGGWGGNTSSVSNDNSRKVVQNITQHISIAGGGRDPRTARQMAQGFIAGAARAAG